MTPSFQSNLKDGYGSGERIYETGCLITMEQWFNKNLYYIGGAALGVAIVQVWFFFVCKEDWARCSFIIV